MIITLLPAGNPGAFTGPTGNNTWLIDGAAPLLVDAGVGAPSHLEALASALAGRALARVFVTHGHRDHSAGVPEIRRRYPDAAVIGGPAGIPAADGAWLPAGDGRVQVLLTPGHSPDHACLWEPQTRAVFAGDLLVSGGTVMIAATSGGSLRDYLASLARVRALDPARIYPGHGPIIAQPAQLIDQYVAHRADRERQVIAALRLAPSSADTLVSAIYPELHASLRSAARETLLAHLRKLEAEGRAMESSGVWTLR
jgi:glyoxylase-like metal-dependent hydrolase (beta-lactamase superfamily II)